MTPTLIKCPNCATLFGIEVEGGVLNIKHRDLFRRIKGECEGPCRRCGSQVRWSSDGSNDSRFGPAGQQDRVDAGFQDSTQGREAGDSFRIS